MNTGTVPRATAARPSHKSAAQQSRCTVLVLRGLIYSCFQLSELTIRRRSRFAPK